MYYVGAGEHYGYVGVASSMDKNSDGTYTVKGSDGKSRIEKEFKDAINFAIETYRKMSKFNKEWEEENDS
jgi:hypothetical protein